MNFLGSEVGKNIFGRGKERVHGERRERKPTLFGRKYN